MANFDVQDTKPTGCESTPYVTPGGYDPDNGAFCGRCGQWNPSTAYRRWRHVRDTVDLHKLYCANCEARPRR